MSQGVWSLRGSGERLAALVVPVLAVPVLVSALVFVNAPSANPSDSGDDEKAVTLLRQSADAADRVSYTGTQYVSTWSALTTTAMSTSAVVEVNHAAGGQTEIALHDEQRAILEGRTATDWLAGDGPVDLMLDAYDVRMAGTGTVAGRDTDIVEAQRHDGTVAVRLWIDRGTALSLRRESFTMNGSPLNASAFVDVTIGDANVCCEFESTDFGSALGSDASTLRWSDIERLRAEGCHCLAELSDGMVLYEARNVGDAVHLSYSDGVMTVSVFEQHGRLDPGELDDYSTTEVNGGTVYVHPGPPTRLTWSAGERVITVIAEAPLDTVKTLVESLPPEGASAQPANESGFFDRLGRGAQRVGSWINPFG